MEVSKTAVSILVLIGVILRYSVYRGSWILLFAAAALANFLLAFYLLWRLRHRTGRGKMKRRLWFSIIFSVSLIYIFSSYAGMNGVTDRYVTTVGQMFLFLLFQLGGYNSSPFFPDVKLVVFLCDSFHISAR